MVDFEDADMGEFIAVCVQRFCPMCGTEIVHKPSGRPKKFCSDTCRRKYWKAHPKKEQWDSFVKQVCPICGRMFFAQHENRRKRKYCSRSCANRSRAQKGEGYVFADHEADFTGGNDCHGSVVDHFIGEL